MTVADFDGRIYFRLLAATAAIDGHVADEEVLKFRELLELAEADPEMAGPLVLEAEERRATPLWFLEGVKASEAFARVCLRDALVLTCVDGWYSPQERALLHQAAVLLDAVHVLEGLPEAAQAEALSVAPALPGASDPEGALAEGALGDALESTSGALFGATEGFDGSLYFRLLAAVAAADGEIREEEITRFGELIELAGGDASLARHLAGEAVMRRRDPLWFLNSVDDVSPTFAHLCLRDAGFVALADGEVAEEERTLLYEAAIALGVDDYELSSTDLQPVSPEWRAEATQVARRSNVDSALAAASGAAVVAGGTYIVAGGAAAKIAAGVAAATAAGAGGFVVPVLLLIGAGVAGTVLQVVSAMSGRRERR